MVEILNRHDLKKIIEEHSKFHNIPNIILEKDYYIVLLLKEVSELQEKGIDVIFKGGTSIYKRYEYPVRFSEDIDLTVNVESLSNSQKKKVLETCTQKFKSIRRTENYKHLEFNKKGVIQSVYEYDSLYRDNSLEKYIIVETSSFTVSEPIETINIRPLLFDSLIKYGFSGIKFDILAIKLERIFMDKIFASESMLRKRQNLEIAKHIYDIFLMLNETRIIEMLEDEEKIREFSYYRLLEGNRRLDSEGVNTKFKFDFILETYISDIKEINNILFNMQKKYNISPADMIYYDENHYRILLKIFNIIRSSWKDRDIPSYMDKQELDWI